FKQWNRRHSLPRRRTANIQNMPPRVELSYVRVRHLNHVLCNMLGLNGRNPWLKPDHAWRLALDHFGQSQRDIERQVSYASSGQIYIEPLCNIQELFVAQCNMANEILAKLHRIQ